MKIYNTLNDLKDTQLKSYAKIPCETFAERIIQKCGFNSDADWTK